MKLIYLGQELDSTKEKELITKSEFGFKVTVTYHADSWMSKHEGKQVVQVFSNCTEVHHLYDNSYTSNGRIAFESDIHQTGCTRLVEDIESVVIEMATTKEDSF